jgi:hypothetical protein
MKVSSFRGCPRLRRGQNPESILIPWLMVENKLDYSRSPWRSAFRPPLAFAAAILQTQSGFRRDDEQRRKLAIEVSK